MKTASSMWRMILTFDSNCKKGPMNERFSKEHPDDINFGLTGKQRFKKCGSGRSNPDNSSQRLVYDCIEISEDEMQPLLLRMSKYNASMSSKRSHVIESSDGEPNSRLHKQIKKSLVRKHRDGIHSKAPTEKRAKLSIPRANCCKNDQGTFRSRRTRTSDTGNDILQSH
ncbi:unnamed protein product [Agarophyton chilense]